MAENLAGRLTSDAAPPLHLGDVMLALGDSIAAGIGAAHVTEGCMWLLAAHLRRLHTGLHFEHLAVPSETSASMLAADGQVERAERTIAALRPGGQRLGDVAVVQTVYNPFEGLPPDSADLMAPRRASRSGYNAAIRRVAQNMGVRLVDISSLFRGRSLELTWVRTGDIHPTGDGHELIAQEYLRVGGWMLP